jgi:Protein of unknown function (DUF2924)
LNGDELRSLWRATFRASQPPAFTKDLIARFLCWHLQEQAFGGLDPKTAKHLAGVVRGDWSKADRPRRLKPGTVLVREYQGARHTVTVVANGFVWREATYATFVTVAVNSCALDSLGAITSRDRASNWSLVTVEPVSPPRKRKLEKSEQRPAPETRVQSSEMPQIADQRPVPDSLTCGNVDAFPFWRKYYAETELYG